MRTGDELIDTKTTTFDFGTFWLYKRKLLFSKVTNLKDSFLSVRITN